MNYRGINGHTIVVLPGELSREGVLEEMARLSYETASSPFPGYIQPVEIPASLVDFKGLITEEGLDLDYLNGRLCSTYVERREDRLVFDARHFEEDRGVARGLPRSSYRKVQRQ